MKSGIYQIVNRVNGKKYIGSAINIVSRWDRHRRELDAGKHHSPHLQRAWNKYGQDSFHFGVISYCDKDSLLATEQQWIDAAVPEYNVAKNTLAPMTGRKHSEETRAKMSAIQTGRKHSAITKHKLREINTGKVCSIEARAQISQSLIGNSYGCGNLGKSKSEEHRAKLTAKNRKNAKGYTWAKDKNKWVVRIGVRGKTIHIGYFTIESDAAAAYAKAIKDYE